MVIATTCWASSEESRDYDKVKEGTRQTENKAAETAEEAKEASESWAEWAKEKITEGLGFQDTATDAEDKAKKASETASDTAKGSKDNIQEVSSGK